LAMAPKGITALFVVRAISATLRCADLNIARLIRARIV
jgi:hypothetical protein